NSRRTDKSRPVRQINSSPRDHSTHRLAGHVAAGSDIARCERRTTMRRSARKGLVALLVLVAQLATPRADAHHGYDKCMQAHRPELGCWNNQDCEPVAARYDETRQLYQALIDGTWTDIPPHTILDQKKIENVNFDGSYHACWNRTTKEVLCFREAEPKS